MDHDLQQHDLTQQKGPLAWFAGNHVAANLLMLFVIVAGVLAVIRAKVEVFPEASLDIVRVTVPYLGASPAEVEEGVCVRVEEAIAGVDGIKRISSIAAEGSGTIVAEVEEGQDVQEVLDDIKTEVDRIETFPEETEKPVITALDNRTQIIRMAVFGDASEKTLKNLANNIRDELTALPDLSIVELAGERRYEISLEISEKTLRRYHLTFDRLSQIIANSSMDLPGGSVKTEGGEILVRTKGQKYTGRDFANIVVLTEPDGTVLHLGDIANVIDGFEDSDIAARYDGKPAVILSVFRIGDQNALDIANTVKDYVAQIQSRLPAGVNVEVWFDYTEYLRGRIQLLTRNGIFGICLVFLCLTLFLDLKLAFWTTLGIPISFCGAFFLLPMFGVSINMLSLFAFVVVLGIVVDDAIVVGENIFDYRQQGLAPLKAAIRGVREMAAPVTMATLTTIAAFGPLFFVGGMMGKFLWVVPIVVISVLSFSLMEAFLILPAHLSTGRMHKKKGPIAVFQGWVRHGLNWFVHQPFGRIADLAMRFRYATLAAGTAIFLIIIGLVAGGHMKLEFFPKMEADNMFASLTMPQGTTRSETERVVRRLENAAMAVQEDLLASGRLEEPIFLNVTTYIGSQPFSSEQGGPHGRGVAPAGGSHLAEVNVQLVAGEDRAIGAQELMKLWEKKVGEVSGASSLTYTSELFRVGDAVNIELSHRNFDTLVHAADDLKSILSDYAGVSQIADSFEPGKVELKLDLTERGRTLGLTLGDLARQVRQGFYGEEVQRIQRGRDDIRVMLRYPESERQTLEDVRRMRVRLPEGTEIPFAEIAQAEEGRGYAAINRADRRRIVSVTAAVDTTVADTNQINNELEKEVLPQLRQTYPGLSFTFEGEKKEQQETFGSLGADFVIALLAIYGLLAVQFRSYLQPVIIMSAIPFGIVGAVVGHLLMGYNLSFMSFFGIVALTGVVVNDSLILVDLVNRRRNQPGPLHDIVRESTQRRFRPILLTTLTTFFGLTPMLMERSLQAKFLIPMAISLGFGVLFATAITLILVPALYLILEDLKRFAAFLFHQRDTLVEQPEEMPASPTDADASSKGRLRDTRSEPEEILT